MLRLSEQPDIKTLTYVRGEDMATLNELLTQSDAVVHLAGVNRSSESQAFADVNVGLTERICQGIRAQGRAVPLILASSAQARLDNPYGRSKMAAEEIVQALAQDSGSPVAIFRLPGVFGKWCKHNYNSVVATFCHNKAHDLSVQINNPCALVRLVYVDDVINAMLEQLASGWAGVILPAVAPEYSITLSELSDQIDAFKNCRTSLVSERVGTGFVRALYATYVSYLPVDKFAYAVPMHGDARGVFVEMLKTPDAGQLSFFTSHPGITRGGHYHHTKTEKFLVIKGRARFGFRHMLTNEVYHLETHGEQPQIVEAVPGWTHDITNIGTDEMMVMLWANEIFDRENPDTIACKV
jgi:UDP-2-acetamido-2,6-beta-L-arabino-hexul-4-ose reductase